MLNGNLLLQGVVEIGTKTEKEKFLHKKTYMYFIYFFMNTRHYLSMQEMDAWQNINLPVDGMVGDVTKIDKKSHSIRKPIYKVNGLNPEESVHVSDSRSSRLL